VVFDLAEKAFLVFMLAMVLAMTIRYTRPNAKKKQLLMLYSGTKDSTRDLTLAEEERI
jgi:hypothetical protein